VQATFSNLSDQAQQLVLRMNATSAQRNMYVIGRDPNNYSDQFTHIQKQVNNTITDLTSSGTTDISAGSIGYAEIKGTTLLAKVGGTQKATISDSSHASGTPGLWVEHSVANAALAFDDFTAGDFTVTPEGTQNRVRMSISQRAA
jgi:hypothetical protein